ARRESVSTRSAFPSCACKTHRENPCWDQRDARCVARECEAEMASKAPDVVDAARLIDALRDALLVIDGATSRLLAVNSAACALSEYTRAELLTMPAAALCPLEQRVPSQHGFDDALTREALGAVYRLDWQTKGGRSVPMEF